MEEEKQGKHWYVIHTYSGYENKVRANLERKVHSLGIVNERNWYAVRNTAGVTGFVGSDSTHPTPLTAEEVRQIMPSMGMDVEATEKPAKIDFQLHQRVRIKTAPFMDFEGTISEINEEKGKLKVLVDIMGRETPVEIDFTQVEEIE